MEMKKLKYIILELGKKGQKVLEKSRVFWLICDSINPFFFLIWNEAALRSTFVRKLKIPYFLSIRCFQ